MVKWSLCFLFFFVLFLLYLEVESDRISTQKQKEIKANMAIAKVRCTGSRNRANGRYREVTFAFILRGKTCNSSDIAPNKEQNAAPFIGQYFPVFYTKEGPIYHFVATEISEIRSFGIKVPREDIKAWLDSLPPLN